MAPRIKARAHRFTRGSWFLVALCLGATPALAHHHHSIVTVKTPNGVRRYQLEHSIGVGGSATVRMAYPLTSEGAVDSQRPVAVKFSREGAQALRDEAGLMERFRGSGVPKVIGMGEHDNEAVLVMELAGSRDVSDVAPRPLKDVQRIVGQILDTLTRMHEKQGGRHNDAYPGNWRESDDGTVYLVDFNRAGDLSEARRRGYPWPTWHAPEVVNGKSLVGSAAPDVYTVSLAIISLLTGTPSPSLIDSDSRIPEWLRPILKRGTDSDPRKRPSARELRHVVLHGGKGN
jgi:serine/threonine protein kinase